MTADRLREHLRQIAGWVLGACAEAAPDRSEIAAVALFNPGDRDPSSLAITEVRGASTQERQHLAEDHGPLTAFNAADWTSLEVVVLDWLLPVELARADERISRELVGQLGVQKAIGVYEQAYVDELAALPWHHHFDLADDFVVFAWNPDPTVRSQELRRRGDERVVDAWTSKGWLS